MFRRDDGSRTSTIAANRERKGEQPVGTGVEPVQRMIPATENS